MEAKRDFFGGVAAKQSIVCALVQGPDEHYAVAEAVAKEMYAPILRSHRITLEQMAMLEPTLAETISSMFVTVLGEALDEAVKRGVPYEAAKDFLMGHIHVQLGIVFEKSNPFSDACLIAIEYGRKAMLKDGWRQLFDADKVYDQIDVMLHPEKLPRWMADRVRRQIRVSTQKVDEATLDGYRAIIAEKLGEIGYGGQALGSDVRRWEADVRVPREQVLDTMRKLTADARTKVSATMYEMGDDWLEPDEVRGVPFSAYCDYPGRKLLLNLDHPYTIYALKHLATHEAFPGHLVHLALRQRYVAEGKMPLDGAQVVTSSASSALFEGIADNGLFFIDWVETPEDELAVALQRLRGALRCNAAWMHHVEGKSIEEIAAANAEAGYMDVATTASRLGFLRHGLRAPFVYAYWCGDMAVHDVWKTVPRERRAEFWQYLYGNMHTPDTLKAFWR